MFFCYIKVTVLGSIHYDKFASYDAHRALFFKLCSNVNVIILSDHNFCGCSSLETPGTKLRNSGFEVAK